MTSPFAEHPAHVELARGYGPCRHCLRTFRVGEENRILFTYDPFSELESEPLPGPVFIHEHNCELYPVDGAFPEDLRSHPLTLNAYSRGRKLLAQEHATDRDLDAKIERLLARPEIDYIHVRDTEAGCYDLRVERGPGRHATSSERTPKPCC
jgi:hypothetical protein